MSSTRNRNLKRNKMNTDHVVLEQYRDHYIEKESSPGSFAETRLIDVRTLGEDTNRDCNTVYGDSCKILFTERLLCYLDRNSRSEMARNLAIWDILWMSDNSVTPFYAEDDTHKVFFVHLPDTHNPKEVSRRLLTRRILSSGTIVISFITKTLADHLPNPYDDDGIEGLINAELIKRAIELPTEDKDRILKLVESFNKGEEVTCDSVLDQNFVLGLGLLVHKTGVRLTMETLKDRNSMIRAVEGVMYEE